MPLKLTLKPGEKFVVNGAVVTNGDKRTTLVVQNRASILREKDVMLPEQVSTPLERIYFAIQMLYIEPERHTVWSGEFATRMTEFMGAISNAEALATCASISRDVLAGEYYKALLKCRSLAEFERVRLETARRFAAG